MEYLEGIKDMKTIQDWLGPTQNAKILEVLVIATMLDPSEEVRKTGIDQLKNFFSNSEVKLNRGFIGDNQILIEVQQGRYKEVIYVADLPKEYLKGHQVKPLAFDLR